ncbi:DUF6973 domain-containing protein [Polaribacter butkevichii]|uniref:DUF6973 domain-containing protein n=1 Tax=Polaribacter butkevichii TaxID=218490 RepID=A0A2P6C784_9FLAO|nr:hypothetical protein [Polaribacter butkevichii]PQJ68789.1 hypothetical protein BTO14_12125 [Polaribacter butkevichii]
MKKYLFFLVLLFSVQMFAQSNFKSFFKLSAPIKKWVLFHPFKAKKSLDVSKEANKVSDSIAKTNLLDGDGAGGQVDAFRHAYWMARMHQEIGERAARSLGKAHEKENYITYKKRNLEEGVVPDKISSEMDLYNNEQGLQLITKGSKISKKGLTYKIVNAIKKGTFKIIKKDMNGNFLTCEGKVIAKESLKGTWQNNKCLVSSKKGKNLVFN